MQAYKRDEMISVTDLLKGFKMTLEKLTSHQLDKVAVMKNNKPEAVIISIDEYERLQSKHYWNRLDEKRVETYKWVFCHMRFKVSLNSFYKPLQIVFPFQKQSAIPIRL